MPGEERLEVPCSVRSMQGSDIVEVVACFAERYSKGGVADVVCDEEVAVLAGQVLERRRGEAAGGGEDAEGGVVVAEGRSNRELSQDDP